MTPPSFATDTDPPVQLINRNCGARNQRHFVTNQCSRVIPAESYAYIYASLFNESQSTFFEKLRCELFGWALNEVIFFKILELHSFLFLFFSLSLHIYLFCFILLLFLFCLLYFVTFFILFGLFLFCIVHKLQKNRRAISLNKDIVYKYMNQMESYLCWSAG